MDALHIGAFRNLQNVRLEQLGRINLLVGSNNAGKTSVLEAVAVLQHPFDPYEWFNVLKARETRSNALLSDQMSVIETLRWMFPIREGDPWGEQPPLPINLESIASGSRDRVSIECAPVHGVIDPEQVRRIIGLRRIAAEEPIEDDGLNILTSGMFEQGLPEPGTYYTETTIWSRLGLRSGVRTQRPRENVQFLAPYGHRNAPANLRLLTEASKTGGRDDIDALLRDLDPRISGVEIITSDDGRYPKLAIRMRNGVLMPQGVFGDGVRRALSIAVALRAAANGILLIDEIEAALHVRALDRVYRWLEESASSFSVQIFATTHSLEAIDAITRIVSPGSSVELSAYSINQEEPEQVKRYTGGMLQRLVLQRGLDIRG